ncbi:hypothetical protein M513_01616, partial [Trichuris suis]
MQPGFVYRRDLISQIRRPMTSQETETARVLMDRWLPSYEEAIEAPNPDRHPEKIKVWASPLANIPLQGGGQSSKRKQQSDYVIDCMDVSFVQSYNESMKRRPSAVEMKGGHVKAAFIYFEKQKRNYEKLRAQIEAEATDDCDIQSLEARLESLKITLSIPEVPARLQLPLLEYWLMKKECRSGRFEVDLADRSADESDAIEGLSTSGRKQKLKRNEHISAEEPKKKPESRRRKREKRTADTETMATPSTSSVPAEPNEKSTRCRQRKPPSTPNDANSKKAEAENGVRRHVEEARAGKAKRKQKKRNL